MQSFLKMSSANVQCSKYALPSNTLNQTEIIYSVFVGGLPVLATTAAEDMKLMSQDEMEHVLETMVYLKADRTYITTRNKLTCIAT